VTADQLDDLFAELRAEEVTRIRPPGAGAARRSVRRRRITAAVSTTAAVLATAVGSAALLGNPPEPAPPPPAASPSAPASPETRATAALGRLVSDDAGLPGIDVKSPVVADFRHTEQFYASPVRLAAACVGTGAITLIATGQGTELGRLAVRCGDEPVPVAVDLELDGSDVVFRLADTTTAGQSGFAFRLTAEAGSPYAPGTVSDDDLSVLAGIVGDRGVREGGTMPLTKPSERFHPNGSYAKAKYPTKPATLVLLCRGAAGTLTMQFWRTDTAPNPDEKTGPTGKLLAEHTVPCEEKPTRRGFLIKESLTKNIETWYRYDAPIGQQAEGAYSVSFP
jgi:hypothetical protein